MKMTFITADRLEAVAEVQIGHSGPYRWYRRACRSNEVFMYREKPEPIKATQTRMYELHYRQSPDGSRIEYWYEEVLE